MKTTTTSELQVAEVFRFEGGRTVFVGKLLGEEKYIPPCRAELLVNDNIVAVIHVEGEMLPNGEHRPGLRSVSTIDELDLSITPVTDTDVRLRFDLSESSD
jgi:hypothetical protein